MAAHVSDDDIDSFVRGAITGDPLVSFADHLADCAECQTRVTARLPSGSDIEVLLELNSAAAHVTEEELHAYVDRRVSGERRRAIDQHLIRCERCAAEIRDLQAFAGDFQSTRMRRSRWMVGLAAAAVLLIAVSAASIWRSRTPTGQVTNEATPPSATPAPQPVESSERRAEPPAPEPRSMSMPSPIVSLVLNGPATRSLAEREVPAVILLSSTKQLQLQLVGNGQAYSTYRVAVQSVEGGRITVRQHVKPADGSGRIVLALEAQTLQPGDYVLTLSGENPDGELDDVSKSLFRVKRH